MEKKIISGEEEIYLAEDKNFYERARELAQKTKKDKKYPFVITYDANQKGTLMSAIESMEGVVLSEEENKVRAQLNMEQLKAIKELDCTVGVQNGTQKYSATREEATEASTGYVLTNNENSGIMTIEADAVAASVEPASYSSYCPDNCCPSPDVLKGMQSATSLAIGRYVSGNICCPGCKKWYKIVVDSSGVYTIHAEGDIDTIGMLYDENGNYIGGNDDYAGKTDFRLIRSLTAGKTYYLKVSGAFGDTGSYVVRVTTKVLPSSVELSHSSIGLKVGETTQIVASILPQNATEQRVTYHCFFTDVISVDSNTGCITAHKSGTATVYVYDWNNNCAPSECEVWVREKDPVFLIHGRTSNALRTWGAENGVEISHDDTEVGDNNHYCSDLYAPNLGDLSAFYIDENVQFITNIISGKYENGNSIEYSSLDGDEKTDTNLAYYLKEQKYVENRDLFVFNYPNEDAVIHNAKKFEAFIKNLMTYVKACGDDEMKRAFFRSKEDYDKDNYKFNIVGHSMGGLVARYYIESIEHDEKVGYHENVDKLITVCTPHWGSGYADLGCALGIAHEICDHDLRFNSAMYGGTFSTELNCNAAGENCCNDNYTLTKELDYSKSRSTKYYAIAGIDYDVTLKNENDYTFEMPTTFTTYQQITEYLTQKEVFKVNNFDIVIPIDIKKVGDNMVGFLSQIGWTGDSNPDDNVTAPQKRILMRKIFVDVDTNGGNGGEAFLMNLVVQGKHGKNILHSKINHRRVVCSKIFEYLGE